MFLHAGVSLVSLKEVQQQENTMRTLVLNMIFYVILPLVSGVS